jgi:magnesium-transporting ATPase (P-type)
LSIPATLVAGEPPVPEPPRALGLRHEDAAARLATYGPNRLAEPPRRAAWRRFTRPVPQRPRGDPRRCGGGRGPVGRCPDAIVIGVVLSSTALGFLQEARERRCRRSRAWSRPRRVQRRHTHEVPAAELVPGDVVLSKGDRVPADGRVLLAATRRDESTLTGESVPADKSTKPLGSGHAARRPQDAHMHTVVVRDAPRCSSRPPAFRPRSARSPGCWRSTTIARHRSTSSCTASASGSRSSRPSPLRSSSRSRWRGVIHSRTRCWSRSLSPSPQCPRACPQSS